MKNTARVLWILVVSLTFALACQSKDFSAVVVDGLGQPIAGATVSIYWLKRVSDTKVDQIDLLKLVSRADGIVKGQYDEKSVPAGESIYSDVDKDGYSGFSMDRVESKYELKKEFSSTDIEEIAKLSGEAQKNRLREILAEEFKETSGKSFDEIVFFNEQELRSAFRSLVTDSKVGTSALRTLSFIGAPEDMELVVENAPSFKKELFDDRWAYDVVTSLLEPTTDKEWSFLEKCAAGESDDLWVDAGAIDTLRLIASPRSSEILQKVLKKNPRRSRNIQSALNYIQSNPVSLSDKDLNEAGKKVAEAIKIGEWQGNKNIRYNKSGDKALIDCEFIAGRDLLVHTATFHRVDGVWKLRGVRETMQALLAKPHKSAN